MRARSFLWIRVAAGAIFILYAASFLYFFVDDEAIPLVYARNVLRGRGFIYSSLEGRVEGYSDFLHVIWSAVLLKATDLLRLPPLAPLVVGKAVSAASGVMIVMVTARMLRQAGAGVTGSCAALAFLALAAPLAIWSCSSLEAAMFGLLITAFTFVLLVDGVPRASAEGEARVGPLRQGVATLLGVALILERIDGFLYVAALIGAGLIAAGPDRRRAIGTLCWRVALAAAIFHGWRYLYFGSLLNAPLVAKVLSHLNATAAEDVRAPVESYLPAFLRLYGVAAAPAFALAGFLAWRSPSGRGALIALVALGAYVQLVGDWMFGWRFLVALLPLAALVIGLAVSRLSPRPAWIVALAVAVWSGLAARQGLIAYADAQRWPVFWTVGTAGRFTWPWPYRDLLHVAGGLVHPGDRVAYNQAGVLPYALDLENIDDLGICSGFVARLPTTDVAFTAVGRYSPLGNQPVLMTAQAYLLYHDVRLLVSRTGLLRSANHGVIPPLLLDGYFRHIATDALGQNAIYVRTDKDASQYRRAPELFTENLAHPSRLLRASIGTETVAAEERRSRLSFLREARGRLTFDTATELTLEFARTDEPVFSLFAERMEVPVPLTMTVALFDGRRQEVARRQVDLLPGRHQIFERFGTGIHARIMTMRLTTAGGATEVLVTDMRLVGQSAVLGDYVRRNLQFSAGGPASARR